MDRSQDHALDVGESSLEAIHHIPSTTHLLPDDGQPPDSDPSHEDDKKAFFDLPIEVREVIYSISMQHTSNCNSTSSSGSLRFHGCTTVLVLNRQVYSEAISTFHEQLDCYLRIDIRSEYDELFLGPPDDASMDRLNIEALLWTSSVYHGVTELTFTSLRQVTVTVGIEEHVRMQRRILELARALLKSTQVQQLTLLVNAERIKQEDSAVQKVMSWMKPLMAMCIQKHIILTARHGTPFFRGGWWRQIDDHGRYTHAGPQRGCGFPIVELIQSYAPLQTANKRLLKPPKSISSTAHQQPSNMHTNENSLQATPVRYAGPQGRDSFELQPECRRCYLVFASNSSLRQHLQSSPDHAMAFARGEEEDIVQSNTLGEEEARARAIDAEIEANIRRHVSQ